MKGKKMRYFVFLIILIVGFIACSKPTPPQSAPHELLNGTWVSNAMTVTIDFKNGNYQGIALGLPFQKKLTLVNEQANIITFKADETTIICQIQQDNSILLTKQPDGIPVILKRQE